MIGDTKSPAAMASRTGLGVSSCVLADDTRNLLETTLACNGETILGIDIGAQGAIAILDASLGLLDVVDMPTLQDGPKGRRAVNAALLAGIVYKSHASLAFVEYVGARPGEGAVGAFAFGRSRGVIEGVLGAAGVPLAFLTPATWKRAVDIPPGKDGAKDAARSEAIRRWPAHASLFVRVKDDGRAEAALIAVAGMMRKGGGHERRR